jgi:hypothetical protein
VTLAGGGVTDAAGNGMTGDYVLKFFVMAGDANRDRTVDFNDLVLLAQNYNTSGGKTWADGDFNGDGSVDFNDLVVMAQRYNTTLPPAPAAAAPTVAMKVTVTPARPVKPVFSTRPVAKPVTKPVKAATAIKPAKPPVVARRT